MSDWIDVTQPLRSGMAHWPGDPDVVVERFIQMDDGNPCNVTRLELCTHAGTHMDAPIHFLEDGVGMEALPLEMVMGPARVLQINDPSAVGPDELRSANIEPGERILLRTRNADRAVDAPFDEDFVYISADAAHFLAQCRVALVGIDGMSVGGFRHDMVETHQALLRSGAWIVENLNLREVAPGNYEILCLPLLIPRSDGAPCRALLKPV